MLRFKGFAALAAAALLLAACSGASATPSAQASVAGSTAPRVVQLEIGVGAITPATVTVTRGETVTFEAKNVSTVEVEIIIGLKTDVDADSGDSLKEAEHIAPGATGTVTYTFDGDGPYAYGDQVGDHYAAGAKGDIVFGS
jgi:plastocyanin